MSAEERRKILQMIEDGKITAQEALILISALDEDESQDENLSDEGDW